MYVTMCVCMYVRKMYTIQIICKHFILSESGPDISCLLFVMSLYYHAKIVVITKCVQYICSNGVTTQNRIRMPPSFNQDLMTLIMTHQHPVQRRVDVASCVDVVSCVDEVSCVDVQLVVDVP